MHTNKIFHIFGFFLSLFNFHPISFAANYEDTATDLMTHGGYSKGNMNTNFQDLCQPSDPGPIGCNMDEPNLAICIGKKSDIVPNKCVCKPGFSHPVLPDDIEDTSKCLVSCYHFQCGNVGYCRGTEGHGNYVCDCPKGYKFNGRKCEVLKTCENEDEYFCSFANRCIPKIYQCESQPNCNASTSYCSMCDASKVGPLECNMTSNQFAVCLRSFHSNVANLCFCEEGFVHPSPAPGIVNKSYCMDTCIQSYCGDKYGGGTCVGGNLPGQYHCNCPEGQVFMRNTCTLSAPCVNENTFYCAKAKACMPLDYVCNLDYDCPGDMFEELMCNIVNNSNTVPCGTGFFVARYQLCDGRVDCDNGFDERDCDNKNHECLHDEFRCESGKCINKESVCNFQYDCASIIGGADFSDENNCAHIHRNCTEGEFMCQNRQCIAAYKKCNGHYDCYDKSDEKDCPKCKEDEAFCYGSRICIKKRWFCDGERDCVNGYDEWPGVCPGFKCRRDEFHCSFGQCIPGEYRCDGVSDCVLGDDEVDCYVPSVTCNEFQFQCNTAYNSYLKTFTDKPGECIPLALRCDHQKTCFDNSDEENCTEYHDHCDDKLVYIDCDGSNCYHKNKHCDGTQHCQDGTDELDCPIKCKSGLTRCGPSSVCIEKWKICDKFQVDCPNGWDEGSLCNVNECLNQSNPCQHKCHDLQIGFECSCHPGFQLHEDGFTCVDIDECEMLGRCSQLCENLHGSFKCACKVGYELINGTFCRSISRESYAFFLKRRQLNYYDISRKEEKVLLSKIRNDVTSFVYDFYLEYVYVATFLEIKSSSVLSRISIKYPKRNEVIYKDDKMRIEDMKFDWVTKNLYFIETNDASISVLNTESFLRSTIVVNLTNPSNLILDPRQGEYMMYWLEYLNNYSSIQKASMDGTREREKTVIMLYSITRDLFLDFTISSFFWFDIVTSSIKTCNTNGENSRVVKELSPLSRPFSLFVFEDSIYWLSLNEQVINVVNKFTGKTDDYSFHGLQDVNLLKFYNKGLMPKYDENPCESQCTQMCLLSNSRNITCTCADGVSMLHDNVTCNTSDAYDCSKRECHHDGVCVNITESGRPMLSHCICKRGYGGRNCDEMVEYLQPVYRHGELVRLKCVDGYCNNDGRCVEVSEDGDFYYRPICICAHGFYGKRCGLIDYHAANKKHVISSNVPSIKALKEHKDKQQEDMIRLSVGLVCGFVVVLFLSVTFYYVYRYVYFNRNISAQELEERNIFLNPIYRPTTVSYSVPPLVEETYL